MAVTTCLAAVLAGPVLAQTAAPRLAYIDSNRVVSQAPGAAEAQAAFERAMAGFQSELEGIERELTTMVEEYERQQVTLSPEARRQRQEAIRSRQAAYQQRAMQLEQQAAEQQSELIEPIMERIRTVLSEIQREEGYAFIFDAAAGGVVAADPALDITQRVITRLRAMAQQGQ